MGRVSRDPSDMRQRRPPGTGSKPPEPGWRWVVIVVVGLLVATVVLPLLIRSGSKGLSYADFKTKVAADQVPTAHINNNDGHISGKLKDGSSYSVTGPNPAGGSATALEALLAQHNVDVSYHTPSSNPFISLLPIILLLVGMVAIYMWLGRRAQGQMTGLMSIGRSRAKVYTTERPKTTFHDVAG